jgi:hypothetical protein
MSLEGILCVRNDPSGHGRGHGEGELTGRVHIAGARRRPCRGDVAAVRRSRRPDKRAVVRLRPGPRSLAVGS